MTSAQPASRPEVDCPSCAGPLAYGAPACSSCGLALTGPAAAELWHTDQQLLALHHRRQELLDWLGRQSPVEPASSVPPLAASAAAQRRGWSGQQVLLAAGALLVLTAAAVFLAVAWSTIGVAGQVSVMALLTAATAGAGLRLARGRLTATAETLGAIAVGLGTADLVAAHSLDLAGLGSVDGFWYATTAAALLAVSCAGASRAGSNLACFPVAGALAAAALPLLAVVAADAQPVVTALAFTGAAALAALAAGWLRPDRAARVVVLTAAWCYLVAGWVVAVVTVLERPLGGSGGLAALLSLTACAGAGWWSVAGRRGRPLPGRAPVRGGSALLAAAVLAAVATTTAVAWSGDHTAVATALLGGVAAAIAAGLSWRSLATPTRADLLARPTGWAVAGLHLLAATSLVLAGGRYLEGFDPQRSALGWSFTGALVATAVAAGAVTRWAGPCRWPTAGYALLLALTAGTVAAAPSGAIWTAAVLGTLSVAAAGVAARRRATPVETLLGATWLVASSAALVAAASATDPAVPTAGAFAVAGLTTAAYALLPRRGQLSVVASVLCSAAVWTLLVDADVHTVEAYSLPLAALLGVVGMVRLRRDRAASSWLTVAPALTVGLLPSALASTDDPALLRPLLVLVAGAAVLLFGVGRRWQAPLVLGALTLAVVTVSQLAPWAVGLPRWLSFGSVGLLLLVLGARYEQRRRNARTAVTWVAALR